LMVGMNLYMGLMPWIAMRRSRLRSWPRPLRAGAQRNSRSGIRGVSWHKHRLAVSRVSRFEW
jgi:hypothetical protein